MSRLRAHRIFCDECDVQPVVIVKAGASDKPTWPTTISGLTCSHQELSFEELAAAKSMGGKIEHHVYFPADPFDLPVASKVIVKSKNGTALATPMYLSAERVEIESMNGMTIFHAYCSGRA